MITFVFGMLLVPLVAVNRLRSSALRGLRHTVLGQLPEFILIPAVLIILLFGFMVYFPNEQITSAHAMVLHVIAVVIAFIVGVIFLLRKQPEELVANLKPEYETKAWITAVIPLAMVGGVNVINQNAGLLLLGIFQSAEEVAVFKVVLTGASVVMFGLQAVNLVIAPYFSRFYAQGDMKRLQQLVTISTRAALLISLPLVIILIFFGGTVLEILFGEEYASGHIPLAIIAVGQLVNASTGSVSILLAMTNHEWDMMKGLAFSAFVNVTLSIVFIPYLGIMGAALVTSFSVIIWNIILWRSVRRKLGIESMAFNIFKLHKPF